MFSLESQTSFKIYLTVVNIFTYMVSDPIFTENLLNKNWHCKYRKGNVLRHNDK